MKFLSWNIGGLSRVIGDTDFKGYVENFDIVCLSETFIDNTFDLTQHFPKHDKYISPALKLSIQGRKSGRVLVLVNKQLTDVVERIDIGLDHTVVLKMPKTLFNTPHDVIVLCTYVPQLGSPYYNNATYKSHIENIDTCILQLLEKYNDFHLILMGDFNARTANHQAYVDDEQCYLSPFDLHQAQTDTDCSRKSKDKQLNDFGKLLLELCHCFDLFIHNGEGKGDSGGEHTFISDQGNSVITSAKEVKFSLPDVCLFVCFLSVCLFVCLIFVLFVCLVS